jgi:DNA-binding NarL/FixJ family response regulator
MNGHIVQDIDNLNLKVLVFDTDYYALQAVNSYLAWDRRTRVTHLSETLADMWAYIDETPIAEQPDIVLFDADHIGGPEVLKENVQKLLKRLPDVIVLCTAPQLGQLGQVGAEVVEAAAEAGARGFLLKQEVRLQIAWAIVYSLDRDFIVTASVQRLTRDRTNRRLFEAEVLPPQRRYPELTDRIRQAISLTVIEGMPAHLAAHEMGISLHTIRGYVKDGYRIMESHDNTHYPLDMTPQERAFMRFTAFEEPSEAIVEENADNSS